MDQQRLLGALLSTQDALRDPHRWLRGDWFTWEEYENAEGEIVVGDAVACACLVSNLGLGSGLSVAEVADCGTDVEAVLNEISAFVIPFAQAIAPVPTGFDDDDEDVTRAPWLRLALWNDRPARTIEQVREAIDKAVVALQGQMAVSA